MHLCRLALVTITLVASLPSIGAAQRTKPPVPDLTAEGQPDDTHDWNLGPTGARGWIWGWKLETTDARQILITEVAPGSPADGVLRVGDVVLGVDGERFDEDARRRLGAAIVSAEASKGRLRLTVHRGGKRSNVTLKLARAGRYADEAPWDCEKSSRILERACEHIAAHMKGDIDGMMNALALLASGDEQYEAAVLRLARSVGTEDADLSLEGRTSGLFAWKWGYRLIFLSEVHLAIGEGDELMPAIAMYANAIARGQSGVGSWGHGMAWPDLNGGELHGRLGGYGAVNQSGLVCHLGLVLAKKAGIQGNEVERAIERANRFASFYEGKGAIPYGDHRPGWDVHDDNGKNSLAAIIFDLQGRTREATFFAKMATASYGERERGHTGNYFSFLWGPLGAARLGPSAAAAFLHEQRWYYDLARRHDGSFGYQGGAGMSGGEHKYGDWDCTGAFAMAAALPKRKLLITGRGTSGENLLTSAELLDVVAAGRGFHSWDLGAAVYDEQSIDTLLDQLTSWSPAVRSRAAKALAKREETEPAVRALTARLDDASMDSRYGACQALGTLGKRAASAVPALTEALSSDDVWLRIQAAYALAGIGDPARSAVPAMLRLAVQSDPNDPREFTQRYLCFCLFYRGGALKMRGLLARSLDGVDRELLYPAVRRLLTNDDGRARGAMESLLRNATFAELEPLMPDILEAIETPSPSGVMFSSGIRLAGLDFLAKNGVEEGIALSLQVTEPNLWGKKARIRRCLEALAAYGPRAKAALPQLRSLERQLSSHRESKALSEVIANCRTLIEDLESEDGPESR